MCVCDNNDDNCGLYDQVQYQWKCFASQEEEEHARSRKLMAMEMKQSQEEAEVVGFSIQLFFLLRCWVVCFGFFLRACDPFCASCDKYSMVSPMRIASLRSSQESMT